MDWRSRALTKSEAGWRAQDLDRPRALPGPKRTVCFADVVGGPAIRWIERSPQPPRCRFVSTERTSRSGRARSFPSAHPCISSMEAEIAAWVRCLFRGHGERVANFQADSPLVVEREKQAAADVYEGVRRSWIGNRFERNRETTHDERRDSAIPGKSEVVRRGDRKHQIIESREIIVLEARSEFGSNPETARTDPFEASTEVENAPALVSTGATRGGKGGDVSFPSFADGRLSFRRATEPTQRQPEAQHSLNASPKHSTRSEVFPRFVEKQCPGTNDVGSAWSQPRPSSSSSPFFFPPVVHQRLPPGV